jgi:hypothetical protein
MLSMLVMSAKKAKIISEGLPPAFRAKFYSIHLESRFQQPRVSLDMYLRKFGPQYFMPFGQDDGNIAF